MAKAKKKIPKAATQRGVPARIEAQRRGVAKMPKKLPLQTTASVESEIPSLAGAGTNRRDREFTPSFPFWLISPFAIMRMWWGH